MIQPRHIINLALALAMALTLSVIAAWLSTPTALAQIPTDDAQRAQQALDDLPIARGENNPQTNHEKNRDAWARAHLAYYRVIANVADQHSDQAQLCRAIYNATEKFINQYGPQIKQLSHELAIDATTQNNEQKSDDAYFYHVLFRNNPDVKTAQYALYDCLHSRLNAQGYRRKHNLEKLMRVFYELSSEIVSAWIGNVD